MLPPAPTRHAVADRWWGWWNVWLYRQPPYLVRSNFSIVVHRHVQSLSAYRGEEVVAGALTTAAGLATDTAVLHAVFGVLLALLAAQAASPRASLQDSLSQFHIEGRLPGEDLSGRVADVGAVEVEPYAADQHLQVLLTQTGVGAGGAGLGAVEAGLDALHQRFCLRSGIARGRLDYPSGVGHVASPFFTSLCRDPGSA